MIATSLWKVTRQPFDSTYDSYPHMLGNSAGILSAVLHYELSFVFLFFPRWIYFLSTSKCRDCSIHQVHGIQRRCYQHVSCVLARKTENQQKHSGKQEQMPERSHISRYSINKPINKKMVANDSIDIIPIRTEIQAQPMMTPDSKNKFRKTPPGAGAWRTCDGAMIIHIVPLAHEKLLFWIDRFDLIQFDPFGF